MANKAVRMISNMEEYAKRIMLAEAGELSETASPLLQARYINTCLKTAEQHNISLYKTMRKCGKDCISHNAIKIAKKLYAKSSSVEDFLQRLNEADIGGRHLHLKDGLIIGMYKKCYCSMPKKIETMHTSYCECSAGWFETLFSEIFEKEVKVAIVDTITNGAPECTFIIDYA